MMRHAQATMGEHRAMLLRRFAPINQEGDCIELDSVVYGPLHEIVLLRSTMRDLASMRRWAIRIPTCAIERGRCVTRENATHP